MTRLAIECLDDSKVQGEPVSFVSATVRGCIYIYTHNRYTQKRLWVKTNGTILG